ncbi:MAG: TetR/AcrR family transcriptional regulator [Nitrospirota bacterium]|nr:TetR/AcrR family transcriptional regulator [Nitrospirota bacterium]
MGGAAGSKGRGETDQKSLRQEVAIETSDRCAQRKREILDAAMSCFADEGYFQTTNRKIARKAGITEGLIYHYFPSKKALLQAIIVEKFQQDRSPAQKCYSRWESRFEQEPPDSSCFREFLLDLGHSTFEGLEKDRDVLRILLTEYRLLEDAQEPLFPKLVMELSMNRFSRLLEKYLAARGHKGKSGALMDSFFIGPIVSTFLFQDLLQGNKVRTLDREFYLNELVNHFMAGIDGAIISK